MQTLLREFGKSIGLGDLAADEQGYVCLSFDDLVVHVQHEPTEDEVAAFAQIGSVDQDQALEIYEALLSANQLWMGTGGATLGLQPEDQTVFIAERATLQRLRDRGFEDWMGGFVDIATYWSARLARINAGGPIEDPDDESGEVSEPPLPRHDGQEIIRG